LGSQALVSQQLDSVGVVDWNENPILLRRCSQAGGQEHGETSKVKSPKDAKPKGYHPFVLPNPTATYSAASVQPVAAFKHRRNQTSGVIRIISREH
jgi:hypothetical protein